MGRGSIAFPHRQATGSDEMLCMAKPVMYGKKRSPAALPRNRRRLQLLVFCDRHFAARRSAGGETPNRFAVHVLGREIARVTGLLHALAAARFARQVCADHAEVRACLQIRRASTGEEVCSQRPTIMWFVGQVRRGRGTKLQGLQQKGALAPNPNCKQTASRLQASQRACE